nr:MAG TPA: hypothetical protein [Caudoviricetes sp.]
MVFIFYTYFSKKGDLLYVYHTFLLTLPNHRI